MKTITVKVLLVHRFEKPAEWRLEIPAMSREEAADLVMLLSNCPSHSDEEWEILRKFPRTGLRSVSVGDVLIIQDETRPEIAHTCHVEPVGFKFHDLLTV